MGVIKIWEVLIFLNISSTIKLTNLKCILERFVVRSQSGAPATSMDSECFHYCRNKHPYCSSLPTPAHLSSPEPRTQLPSLQYCSSILWKRQISVVHLTSIEEVSQVCFMFQNLVGLQSSSFHVMLCYVDMPHFLVTHSLVK